METLNIPLMKDAYIQSLIVPTDNIQTSKLTICLIHMQCKLAIPEVIGTPPEANIGIPNILPTLLRITAPKNKHLDFLTFSSFLVQKNGNYQFFTV